MKVLHIYKDYYPVLGGIENHIKLLAERLAQAGLEVTVLVTHPTSRTTIEELNGVRIIKAGRWATVASTPLSPSLPLWVWRLPADLIHLHFPYPLGEISYLLAGKGRRAVVTYHSDVIRQKSILRLYRPLLLAFLGRVERIIATSPNYIQSSPYLARFQDKCLVLPLGIDIGPFTQMDQERVAALRKRYPGPLLLFVGMLRYYKGLDYLLQAMRETPARLLIVGEGPMRAQWEALSQELGLAEKVAFLGRVNEAELPSFYQAADLFVLPACERSEAFGLVQVEAMAAGLPVLSTELGTGTSFVNQQGRTGLVVPPRDPAALQEAILTLLGDPARRRMMGEEGRQRARAEFSAEAMVEGTLKLYAEL